MSLSQFVWAAFLAVLVLFLPACGGGGGDPGPDMGDANRAPSHITVRLSATETRVIESVKVAPKINVGANTHAIEFAIHEGRLWTLEPPAGNPGYGGLLWSEVAEVRWNSQRSGSGANSVARAAPNSDGKVTLPNTPNNDKEGGWTVVTKSGETWFLRAGQWFMTGQTVTINANFQVSYGNYREASLKLITKNGQRFVQVHFGANVISGVYPPVFREEVEAFRWNTRGQDWSNPAIGLRGPIETDAAGDYLVDIGPIPTQVDLGGISAVLKQPKNGSRFAYLAQDLAGFQVGPGIRIVVDDLRQRLIEIKFPN